MAQMCEENINLSIHPLSVFTVKNTELNHKTFVIDYLPLPFLILFAMHRHLEATLFNLLNLSLLALRCRRLCLVQSGL